MATGVNAVCVKCKITQENQADKVLKCYGGCSNFIHYVCSAFKPTELKLFDTHNNNVKWCCDNCGREKKGTYVSDLYSKILDMDKKIDRMFSIIYEQSIKIEKQNNIIKKLEVSSSSEQQTKVEQTTLLGPTTRSNNILTESSKDTKSYAKSLSTQSNKNQTIQDKHTEMASCFSRTSKLHGGSCILVPIGTEYTELESLKEKSKELVLECSAIKIKNPNLVIINIYRPPTADTGEFLRILNVILQEVPIETTILLSGDFNIDLAKRERVTESFLDILWSYNLHPTIDSPTRVTDRSQTLLRNLFSISYGPIIYIQQSIVPRELPIDHKH
ncbi:hypothetical protein QE152_g14098 [Popillia japonica]|uniref:PHD-type domain-containing protein n=1 Tax=Popillia japonica TaxID=7064 RepID=A0AAW1LB26_POPJA